MSRDGAHAAQAIGSKGFTSESPATSLRDETGKRVPRPRVGAALTFMKERGCVVPLRGRRHKPGSTFVHADAMIEYHALRERGQPD